MIYELKNQKKKAVLPNFEKFGPPVDWKRVPNANERKDLQLFPRQNVAIGG